ncbi:transmembrane protein 130 isoform X2 [Hoplias malabaricus]|uniref:transmembrane protein 130 isoform X2 n=1 Tax=Hoplias malabaricus TaxID=27720 RepID=UPI0034626DE8
MYCVKSIQIHVIVLLLFTFPTLCISDDLVQSSVRVIGKVTFHQTEGNSTYLRDSGELAANIPTMISFELSDRQRSLRAAKFMYTWDLGNGHVIKGPEPVLHCHYTSSGNYTFHLTVGANLTRTVRLTGLYSMNLTVLDAITSIELRGPLSFNLDQRSSLSFLIAGSLPVWLCWRILPKCHSLGQVSCKSEKLYDRQFKLDYTFKSVGTHCLDLSAQNDISELQTSYSIHVQKNLSLLIFILPCASLIIATIIFISISACRTHQESLRSKAHGGASTYLSFAVTEVQIKEGDTNEGPESHHL